MPVKGVLSFFDDNNTGEQRLNQFISLVWSSRVCQLKERIEKEVFYGLINPY